MFKHEIPAGVRNLGELHSALFAKKQIKAIGPESCHALTLDWLIKLVSKDHPFFENKELSIVDTLQRDKSSTIYSWLPIVTV